MSEFQVGASGGQIKVQKRGAIVHIDAIGPFDLEAVRNIAQLRDVMVKKLSPIKQRYATLVHWHDNVVISDEGLAELKRSFEYSLAQGYAPVAQAWVIPAEFEGAAYAHTEISWMIGLHGIPFKRCFTVEEAEGWLQQELILHHEPNG